MSEDSKRRLGDYYVGKRLGQGLTSTVRLGQHCKTGQRVALKILNMQKLNQSKSLLRALDSEILALKKISHKNVLRLIEADLEAKMDGVEAPYLVLELAPNGELLDYLMYTGSFNPDISRTYFSQLISAIKYCHDLGFVHRDLKPDNLLLDANFLLKVSDFGFASNEDIMHTYTGTKAYMAPEVLQVLEGDSSGYSGACDIWSCGVILFIMSSGFPPYQAPEKGDWWFERLKSKDYQMFWKAHESHHSSFDSDWKGLIEGILEVDAEKRFTMKDILKSKWMEGKILDRESLLKELQRKKPVVDERKRLEAIEAKSSDSRRGMRAISMQLRNGSISPSRREPAIDVKSLPEPPKYEEPVVKCYTTIEMETGARAALGRTMDVLVNTWSGVKFSRTGYEVDAHVSVAGGNVNLMIEVFSIGETSSIVLIRRLAGPWQEFRKMFLHLKKHSSPKRKRES